MSKCPCENCICVAVCMHKDYNSLLNGCSLMCNRLYSNGYVDGNDRRDNFYTKVEEMKKALTPSRWTLSYGMKYVTIVGLENKNGDYK